MKNFCRKGCGQCHVTLFKNFKPLSSASVSSDLKALYKSVIIIVIIIQYFWRGVDKATLFKFGKWTDYAKSHHNGKKIS